MAKSNRTTLKQHFQTGDIPTEQNYADFIDSKLNLVDTATSPQIVASAISASYLSSQFKITASLGISSSLNTTSSFYRMEFPMSGSIMAGGGNFVQFRVGSQSYASTGDGGNNYINTFFIGNLNNHAHIWGKGLRLVSNHAPITMSLGIAPNPLDHIISSSHGALLRVVTASKGLKSLGYISSSGGVNIGGITVHASGSPTVLKVEKTLVASHLSSSGNIVTNNISASGNIEANALISSDTLTVTPSIEIQNGLTGGDPSKNFIFSPVLHSANNNQKHSTIMSHAGLSILLNRTASVASAVGTTSFQLWRAKSGQASVTPGESNTEKIFVISDSGSIGLSKHITSSGNIHAGGFISASGEISGSSLKTNGNVTATNTGSFGYVASTGYISASGTDGYGPYGEGNFFGSGIRMHDTDGGGPETLSFGRYGQSRIEGGANYMLIMATSQIRLGNAEKIELGTTSKHHVTASGNISCSSGAIEAGGLTVSGQNINFLNLPTSNPGGSGKVWNDSGILRIT